MDKRWHVLQSSDTCARKVRYRSKKRAVNAAVEMSKRGDDLEPYECLWCGGWHIGHMVKHKEVG